MPKPERKYLRKLASGKIFGYTEALAGRPDMIPCDVDGNRTDIELPKDSPLVETSELEIMGSKFDVPNYLVQILKKLIASKTPENAVVRKTEMIINGNSHQVPDSMVMDIAAIGETMKQAVAASGELQEKLSKSIHENKELEKDRDRVIDERAASRREATNLKKKIEAIEK